MQRLELAIALCDPTNNSVAAMQAGVLALLGTAPDSRTRPSASLLPRCSSPPPPPPPPPPPLLLLLLLLMAIDDHPRPQLLLQTHFITHIQFLNYHFS
jgi:MYXO-CTERM domain-containing protein